MTKFSKYPPRCMSTQHPDHAGVPSVSETYKIHTADEVREFYRAFCLLHCDDGMLDLDGKSACNRMVAELFSRYGEFFKEKKLGEDIRLTIRIPNPEIERTEAKIIPEILGSITRSYDAAKAFYEKDAPVPIFEVILPMTTSAESLNEIYHFYAEEIIGRRHRKLNGNGKSLTDLFGDFGPEKINVIPLFEDCEHMLDAHNITKQYLADKDLDSQRVFLAASDTALNYGLAAARLLNHVAISRLYETSKETGVEIYPILGVGSSAFRGNLSPKLSKNLQKNSRGFKQSQFSLHLSITILPKKQRMP